jgi:hypothetical protein
MMDGADVGPLPCDAATRKDLRSRGDNITFDFFGASKRNILIDTNQRGNSGVGSVSVDRSTLATI